MKSKIWLLVIILMGLHVNCLFANKEELSPYQILRAIANWPQEIDQFSINFSLSYKDSDGKIQKVERRKISFLKKHYWFTYFREELLHPEKIIYQCTQQSCFKYNKDTQLKEEEKVFVADNKAPDKEQKKLLQEAIMERLKEITFPGANLPKTFRFRSVYNRAKVVKELVYNSKLCLLISTRSSQTEGQFWISKDNYNLLKYVINYEDGKKEYLEVVKKRKFSEEFYVPVEVKKKTVDAEGNVLESVDIRYYGFYINRKLPDNTFNLK